MNRYQIVIADDHPLFRDALRQALVTGLGTTEIEEAGSINGVSDLLTQSPNVDLVLLDLNMPGVRGYSGLLLLRAQFPEIPVVIVSATDDATTIGQCIQMGASGFIPKSLSVDQIFSAIKLVLDGQIWTPPDVDLSGPSEHEVLVSRLASLTPQQIRVLMMLGEGLLNKQIAYEFGVSEATIKAHVSAILQKLHVDSRTQAVIAVNRIESGDWQRVPTQS